MHTEDEAIITMAPSHDERPLDSVCDEGLLNMSMTSQVSRPVTQERRQQQYGF